MFTGQHRRAQCIIFSGQLFTRSFVSEKRNRGIYTVFIFNSFVLPHSNLYLYDILLQIASPVTNESPTLENCPANTVLQQIIVILSNYLSENGERNYLRESAVQKDSSEDDEDSITRRLSNEKLIVPLSKMNSLKQLLESNVLPKKLRAKVSVRYELPSGEEMSCKQTLAKILRVLNEANLMREYYRSCGPQDICPADVTDGNSSGKSDLLSTATNTENNYQRNKLLAMFNEQKSNINAAESKGDVDNFLKYLLSNKNNDEILTLLKNYRTNAQLNALNDTAINELLHKFSIRPISVGDSIENLPVDKKILLERLLTPSTETSNQNRSLSDVIADVLLHESKLSQEQNTNIDRNPNNLLLSMANTANVVSLTPFENSKNFGTGVIDSEKQINRIDSVVPDNNALEGDIEMNKKQSLKNTVGRFPDTLDDVPKNVSTNNMIPLMNTVQTGDEYQKLVNNILQYQLQDQQPSTQQASIEKSQSAQPLSLNPNVVLNGGKYVLPYGYSSSSVYQLPYQVGSAYSTYYTNNGQYRYPNLSQLKTPALTNQNMYQTYVNGIPHSVDSNSIDKTKQARQQYAPNVYNFANPQRVVGVSDRDKLDSDNRKIVELTYMLKRPKPVVYQPVYFVKYHLPYDAFVHNLRELLIKKPQLRSDPAKLYQELLAVSKLADVSPSLKGVGKEQLTQMVATNGALVNTKVLKINETLLEKQLETIRNFNSILTPNEIANITYSVKAVDQSGDLDKFQLKAESDQTVIKNLDDILHRDITFGNVVNEVNTELPSTKSLVDYEIPHIPPLG